MGQELDQPLDTWSSVKVMQTSARIILVASAIAYAKPAAAQTTELRNDNVRVDSTAAISCGFCSMDKFGAIFYLADFPGVSFPMNLTKVKIALSNSLPTQTLDTCTAASSGMTNITYTVYVGQRNQADFNFNPISTYPQGAWPTETLVTSGSAPITFSVPTGSANGANPNYNLMLNEIPINNAANFGNANDKYIRVLFDMPNAGPTSSPSCDLLGLGSPGGVPFRDVGIPIDAHKSYIFNAGYTFGTLVKPPEWIFNEDFRSQAASESIGGDWIIRLEVESANQPPPMDAGVPLNPDAAPPPPADSGVVVPPDTGVQMPADSGTQATPDTGVVEPADSGVSSADPPTITAITPSEAKSDNNTPVVILGTGFVAGAEARVGQIPMLDVEVSGASTIRATVPAGIADGVYDILVENPDGQIALLQEGFAIGDASSGSDTGAPPAVSSCSCAAVSSAEIPKPTSRPLWGVLVLFSVMAILRRKEKA
ncbi:MAG: IPT/TIG domain-containing protein [Myxococcota bacterium]|nr:IPT/TIG domain-containing protein [Myxococcota bacterium]